jgi:serine/threonine protein kinase
MVLPRSGAAGYCVSTVTVQGGDRHSGQVIGGRYQLEKVLGAGGMGEVWQARHLSLHTTIALKFLRGSSVIDSASRSRFELEARVTAQLKTRSAVQVFDFGVADDGQPFLAMELLEGESLAQRLRRVKRMPADATVYLLNQASRALDRAHALGIVHRDFKPGNVFIVSDEDRREVVKVMDFGLAKIVGELESPGT